MSKLISDKEIDFNEEIIIDLKNKLYKLMTKHNSCRIISMAIK